MKYKIKIYYSTGNSFGSEDVEEYIDLEWEDLNVAKENLQRIKEHYSQYEAINSYFDRRTSEEIYNENMDKNWFVYKPKLFSLIHDRVVDENQKEKLGDGNWKYVPDNDSAQYCIKLKTDGGIDYQMTAFWCGYFEQLYSAKIEIDNSDMKIMFN